MWRYNILFCLVVFFIITIEHVVAASPVGYIDGVTQSGGNTISISGWAQDPDDSRPSYVHLYIDGLSGTALGSVLANISSNDVGAHRFYQTYTVPAQYLDGQTHRIVAYGIDYTGDPNALLKPTDGFPFQMVVSGQAHFDLSDLHLTSI